MGIKIRQARPEDAKLLAWCMLMAGRSHLDIGIWDFVISQPEERCLQFLEMLALGGAAAHGLLHRIPGGRSRWTSGSGS